MDFRGRFLRLLATAKTTCLTSPEHVRVSHQTEKQRDQDADVWCPHLRFGFTKGKVPEGGCEDPGPCSSSAPGKTPEQSPPPGAPGETQPAIQGPCLLAHQLLYFPIFLLLELLNEAFKDGHLELYVLGHLRKKKEVMVKCLPFPALFQCLWASPSCKAQSLGESISASILDFLKGRSHASFFQG